MKKIIITSILLFTLETLLHTLIIAIFIKNEQKNDIGLFGGGYIKLKIIFYLLPYLIAHTHFIRNRKYDFFKFGIFQALLFVCSSILVFPIVGMLFNYFFTFIIISGFLISSFVTPLLIFSIQKVILHYKCFQNK
jgi:hypothetical protein